MSERNICSQKTGDSYWGKSERVLGKQAEVKAGKQEIVIDCKDPDEVKSRENISVKEQLNFGGIEDSAIKRMKKAYGETKIAIINLPVESPVKLITAGKLRIGLT